jgi:hypothetical protein
VSDSYTKGGGDLGACLDWVVEEFCHQGVEVGRDEVKQQIRACFDRERTRIQQYADWIASKYSMPEVDMIRLAKIYPNNVSEIVGVGARQTLDATHYRNGALQEDKDSDIQELEVALEGFQFKGSLEAVVYGPVHHQSDIFDGQQSEEPPADAEA